MDVTTEQSAFREDLLRGKTAIVTGASRGIGAAIAHSLCESGGQPSSSVHALLMLLDRSLIHSKVKGIPYMRWLLIFPRRQMWKH